VGDGPDRLTGAVEYNTDLFDRTTVLRMAAALQRLLAAAVAAPDRGVWDLELASEAERHQVHREWNDTETPGWPPEDWDLAGRFAAVAAAHPDAPALAFEDGRLTYGELEARANRLAHHLTGLGVAPGDRVGILQERSAAFVVAVLAAVKAGAAYVPLDPAYPEQRRALMIRDAGVGVVITEALLQENAEAIGRQPSGAPATSGSGASLAYVMFTSGSTGVPKGIAIPHRAVLRLVLDTNYVRLAPGDRVAQASNTSFDAATFEIWGALLNGACLVGVPREVALSPEDLGDLLERERIAALFLTTALLQQLAADRPAALRGVRNLLFGGEVADPGRIRGLLASGNRPERLLHMYGPTEGTTFTTAGELTEAREGRSLPIGRPITATTVHLLDRLGRPVPLGAAGELCAGGSGLAWGYPGRPDLTAERFVPDPYAAGPRARLYRTGDLCRFLPDGRIDFLGRFDSQVKLRGFRIELGEIEAALAAQAGVREALVLVREDTPGDRRLVAYVAPEPERPAASAAELREALRARLPDYMVPAAFVEMESLPLNPNGKVDRAALPAPEGGRSGAAVPYVEPGTALEREIAAAVREVLGLDRVGRDDSFFDLGAHSLSMIRIATALTARLGRPVRVIEIFRFPNVAALARHLGEAEEAPLDREAHDRRADARRQSMSRRREMRRGR
jgi:amino acid adenylation domain-containing protein